MSASKLINPFYDIQNHQNRETRFFFLEHVLKARADLNLETGHHEHDQEINIYIAGLLNSLIESDSFLKQKPYISSFDIDIRIWLDTHPGLRNQYMVYRDNADFGLILLGLFLGYKHSGSYHHIVLPQTDEQGRIAIYYELAASALIHLQGNNNSLVNVFTGLSEYLPEILQILKRAAGHYFDLIERLSDGSFYHLQKEIDELEERKNYQTKLDLFLKTYSEYKDNPSAGLKKNLLELVEELQKINVEFRFDELNEE